MTDHKPMDEKLLGDILDGLDVRGQIETGDLVSDAVVVLKCIDVDGRVGLTIATSKGLSWVDQIGLVSAADMILRTADYRTRGDDG